MPVHAEWRGAGKGQMEQLYRVWCADCPRARDVRSLDGVLEVGLATRWAREAGWSLGQDKKWRCPACKKRRSRKPNTSEAVQDAR